MDRRVTKTVSEPSKNPQVGGLLRVADDLCLLRGSRHVQQAALRRAISTAYYAVFHSLCTVCADGLVGWSRADLVPSVYRALDHAAARRRLIGQDIAAISRDMAQIGTLFETLQEQRHVADYAPPSILVTRPDALALVAQARTAVGLLGRLDARTRTKLAVLLLVARRPA